MKTIKYIFPILFFAIFALHAAVFSQEKPIGVKFVVVTQNVPKDSTVRITGSRPELGNWWPTGVRMERMNDSTWSKTFQFKQGGVIQYKFNLGSWETEALNQDSSVPQNSILTVAGDTEVVARIANWKNQVVRRGAGKITGTVKYFHNLAGRGITPRDIIVWLPPSYTKNKTKRYPVLYMHDGQNLFDPSTSFTGVDWHLDEAADSLINAGAIKEIIIVGIYNTADRTEEYSNTKLGQSYMNFVVNTVRPFIQQKFRVLKGRENTAVGGSSMGGLISLMLAWNYPDVFSGAACLSPAFHIETIDYVSKIQSYEGEKKPLKIYVDIGTREIDSVLAPGAIEMVNVLKQKISSPEKNLEYYLAAGAGHNEAAWAERNWRYLEFLFGTK